MNTNQSGLPPASWSNASGTREASHATEQSNGAYPDRNGQNIDKSTGYGIASQWKMSTEDIEHSNSDFRNEATEDLHRNFTTEVHESAKPGNPTLEKPRDGNLTTGDNAPVDSRTSGTRTGVLNENGDEEVPQEHLQQQGQRPLHRNVTLRKFRDRPIRTPRQLIRAASREAKPYAKNDSDHSTTANIHDNDAAGRQSYEDRGGLPAENIFDHQGHTSQHFTTNFRQHITSDPDAAPIELLQAGAVRVEQPHRPHSWQPTQVGQQGSGGSSNGLPLWGQNQVVHREETKPSAPPTWVDTAQWTLFQRATSPHPTPNPNPEGHPDHRWQPRGPG